MTNHLKKGGKLFIIRLILSNSLTLDYRYIYIYIDYCHSSFFIVGVSSSTISNPNPILYFNILSIVHYL